MMKVSKLFIYPVKSLGGIELQKSAVSERGLAMDRRWMLVNQNDQFMTQRKHPEMALLGTKMTEDDLIIFQKRNPDQQVSVPIKVPKGQTQEVQIWNDQVHAHAVSKEADMWISDFLGQSVRLVFMPVQSRRQVDLEYAREGDITSFSDGYPTLIIGQASLDNLNGRLKKALPMNRFRPNIVFENGEAFIEDHFEEIRIGEIRFFGVKPCIRCNLTTIDQETAMKGKEPLATLSTFRTVNHEVQFGMNFIHEGLGEIRVGDEIHWIKGKDRTQN